MPGLVTPAPGNSDPSAESTPSHASQHFPHFYGQERAGQSANLSSTLILIFTLNNCKNGCKYVDCCSPVLHLKTFIKGDDEVTVSVELEENCTLYCAHRHFRHYLMFSLNLNFLMREVSAIFLIKEQENSTPAIVCDVTSDKQVKGQE